MKKAALIIFGLVLIFSCKKEKPYWDADIVAPVATSSLNLSNLFPDTLIETNADGSLSIALSTDLFRFTADSLIKLPDTTFSNIYAPLVFPGSYFTYTPGTNFNFAPNNEVTFDIANGAKLKEAVIRSGKLHLEIENPLRQPTIFTCSVPSATKNAVPLAITVHMPPGTTVNPAYKDTFIDVSNYRVDFTGSAGNKSNTILQNLSIQIDPSANTDTLKYGDTIRSLITFMDLIPQFGRGYFGTQTIQVGPDTTIFDVFNQIHSGSLALDSANIQLLVSNEFGADMRATINMLQSLNLQNGNISLSGNGIGSPFNVGRATATGNPATPVIPYNKTLSFTNTNSNITQFIGNLPRSISYNLNAQVNPLGNVSGFNDFVYYGTSLSARLDAHIPLKFSANNIALLDTTDFNITALEDEINNINEGVLKLKAVNSYPFILTLTAMLLDDQNMPIEPLISAPGNSIMAPSVNPQGISIGSRETIINIPFDKGKLESMKKARKIAYYITFNTVAQPAAVTFLDTYSLNLLLTADFNYTINR